MTIISFILMTKTHLQSIQREFRLPWTIGVYWIGTEMFTTTDNLQTYQSIVARVIYVQRAENPLDIEAFDLTSQF